LKSQAASFITGFKRVDIQTNQPSPDEKSDCLELPLMLVVDANVR